MDSARTRSDLGPEFSKTEAVLRGAIVAGGGALALLGLTRRSKPGLALSAAGALLALAAAQSGKRQKLKSRSTIQINVSPQEAYSFWRDFENLPRFMHHLDAVTVLSPTLSKWTALGPGNSPITWEAEITSEMPNEKIVWRAHDGSKIVVGGAVEFEALPAGRGTLITADLSYMSPGGNTGRSIAKILGKDPGFVMRQDLRRFKALMETGEIPTTEGQSHGPRSLGSEIARAMNPDRRIKTEADMREAVSARRNVS